MEKPLSEGETIVKAIKELTPYVIKNFEMTCVSISKHLVKKFPKEDSHHLMTELLTESIQALVERRRHGQYHYGRTGAGNCYEAALMTYAKGVDYPGALLVHGSIVDQKKQRCGHAWIELADIVLDPSNHYDWPMAVEKTKWYATMQAREEDIRRYDEAGVMRENGRALTFGPWHGPDAT